VQVNLRHAHVGLYYAGRKHWVNNADAALNLETIEHAAEVSREEDFADMEIFVSSDDPGCDLVLPIAPRTSNGVHSRAA
jgi:hypothetical protein